MAGLKRTDLPRYYSDAFGPVPDPNSLDCSRVFSWLRMNGFTGRYVCKLVGSASNSYVPSWQVFFLDAKGFFTEDMGADTYECNLAETLNDPSDTLTRLQQIYGFGNPNLGIPYNVAPPPAPDTSSLGRSDAWVPNGGVVAVPQAQPAPAPVPPQAKSFDMAAIVAAVLAALKAEGFTVSQ